MEVTAVSFATGRLDSIASNSVAEASSFSSADRRNGPQFRFTSARASLGARGGRPSPSRGQERGGLSSSAPNSEALSTPGSLLGWGRCSGSGSSGSSKGPGSSRAALGNSSAGSGPGSRSAPSSGNVGSRTGSRHVAPEAAVPGISAAAVTAVDTSSAALLPSASAASPRDVEQLNNSAGGDDAAYAQILLSWGRAEARLDALAAEATGLDSEADLKLYNAIIRVPVPSNSDTPPSHPPRPTTVGPTRIPSFPSTLSPPATAPSSTFSWMWPLSMAAGAPAATQTEPEALSERPHSPSLPLLLGQVQGQGSVLRQGQGQNPVMLGAGAEVKLAQQKMPTDVKQLERNFREKRLERAVEVLEGLHEHGNLDMGQVYHKRFFEECKAAGAPAVPLAFRFLTLILGTHPAPLRSPPSHPSPSRGPRPSGSPDFLRRSTGRSLLQAFTLVMSLCAHCGDGAAAVQAMKMAREKGVRPDTTLYTALITALCNAAQLDQAFKFFYEMEGDDVPPNSHTMCALIDGCGRARMVAKAFGVYGLMQAKGIQPDRAVYNALITACVRAGATERAFDILDDMQQDHSNADMGADLITAGALLSASFSNTSQRERALEVYRQQLANQQHLCGVPQSSIPPKEPSPAPSTSGVEGKLAVDQGHSQSDSGARLMAAAGSSQQQQQQQQRQAEKQQGHVCGHDPVVMFTAAVHACSATGDWEQAMSIFQDLKSLPGVQPDEVFASAMLDVARHAGRAEEAEAVLEELELQMGVPVGAAVINALMSLYAQMGLKHKALAVQLRLKSMAVQAGSSNVLQGPAYNALISLLCAEGDLEGALRVTSEMKSSYCPCGPDQGTYTLLLMACIRNEAQQQQQQQQQQNSSLMLHKTSTGEAFGEAGQGQGVADSTSSSSTRSSSSSSNTTTPTNSSSSSSSSSRGGLLALELYQMARQENVRIGLRLCELMIDLCAVMVAKGAPAPPLALIEGLSLGEAPPQRHQPGQSFLAHAPGLPAESLFKGGGVPWVDRSNPGPDASLDLGYSLAPNGTTRKAGPRFWPRGQEEGHWEGNGSGSDGAGKEGEGGMAEMTASTIGSAMFQITGWRLVAVKVFQHSIGKCGVVPTLNMFSKLLALLRNTPPPSHPHPALQLPESGEPQCPQNPQSQGSWPGSPSKAAALAFHPLAFALYQEAENLGALPRVASSVGPIALRLETFPVHLAELSLLLVLRRLQRRLRAAPGLMLFPLSIHVAVTSQELVLRTRSPAGAHKDPSLLTSGSSRDLRNNTSSSSSDSNSSTKRWQRKGAVNSEEEEHYQTRSQLGVRQIQLASRTGHAVASLLRRQGIPFIGSESQGVLRVTAGALTSWLRSADTPTRSLDQVQVQSETLTVDRKSLGSDQDPTSTHLGVFDEAGSGWAGSGSRPSAQSKPTHRRPPLPLHSFLPHAVHEPQAPQPGGSGLGVYQEADEDSECGTVQQMLHGDRLLQQSRKLRGKGL